MNLEVDVRFTSTGSIRSLVINNIVIHEKRADILFLVALIINQTNQCTQSTLTPSRIINYGET
jgi:hypothetical protein